MRIAMLMLAGFMLLPGCDMLVDGAADAPETTKPADVKAKAKEAKKKRSALDEAIAAQDDYVYNPIGKRDPFRSFLSFGTRTEDDSPRTPLQKYELDQYLLVGIIWGIERPRALVQDPEKNGHVMEIGTYIGKNWGKVTQINAGEVIVTEEYQTIDGELVVNNISMQLPTSGELGGR